jgi:MFS superfamily sulfate permease-like transporter
MQGHDDATMLATSTIGLSLATAVLGCGLVLVGKLRLAQYVQFLPTCVVGGYLAFIGWFCGISGVMLMAGSSNLTLAILRDKFVFVLPGLAGGALIYLAVTKLRHMAALPTSIFMEICIFYMILWATGTTVDEATDDGWIRRMEKPLPLLHTWDFFRFDKVDWSVFPNLILTELSMIFVVSLSSSLDVAAIEIELNKPLHYNHELKMVGISNIVSGITGGYTGSYIFSQSIFSLRAGIRSRLAGFVLALVQFLVLALPFPILKYVPNFFFGSLLAMICIDLMFEWLWDVRHRVTRVEHWICFSTFALIHVLEVEYGILAGVTLYLACKKAGFDVGESKFISHEDILEEEAIIEMQVDDMDSDDTSSKPTCYGTM